VFAPGFDPSTILSQENSGFDVALSALIDPKLVGEETMEDGTAGYHISATAQGEDVSALVVNLVQMTGSVTVDVYIDKAEMLPVRFIIVQPDTATDQTEPTTWTIDLFDFDAAAGIELPDAAEATAQP
jgi:lipoprotein LprG